MWLKQIIGGCVKFWRNYPFKVVCLRNMVGAEEVDESLEEEIEEECKKYGDVDNVIIYNVRTE